ncbi:MAG: hypothetical protein WC889_02800 [Myxococcota bacterium]|jgi:hypothetical protein
MGSKKTTETKTTNTLPGWLTSPYQSAVQNAGQLAQQPAISTGTQGAIDNIMANPGNAAATGTLGTLSGLASGNFGDTALTKAANGYYLNPETNPYIADVAQRGADTAQSRINSQFGAAGRSNGSGLYAQLFGQGIADASNDVYADNYRFERGNQQAAAGGLMNTQLSASSQIPAILQAIMSGTGQALAAGQYQDQAPLNQQQQYAGILSGLAQPFGQQNSTQTQSTSGLGSVLGTIAQLGGAAASFIPGIGQVAGPAMAAAGGGFNPINFFGGTSGALGYMG